MAKDMTVGNPFKLILFFSIPVFLGNLFQQFYSMVDTFIVGRYIGENALAAVGASGAIVFLVLGFAFGITQGFGVIIARIYGAKDYRRLKHFVAMSLELTIVVSLILTSVFVGQSMNLLKLMNTPSNIIDTANSYVIIIYLGIIVTMFYNACASILRGIGDSKTPLYFLIISSFLNIIFDLIFILKFDLNVAGAAYATILTQAISAVISLIYTFTKYEFLRPSLQDFYPDFNSYIELLKVGLSMAMNYSIIAVGVMFLQSGVNHFGSGAVAAFTAASKVENLGTLAMPALGAGAATYIAQNLGAKKYQRIIDGVRKSILMGLVITIFSILFYAFLSEPIVGLFIPGISSETMFYASSYLYTSALFLIFLQAIFIFRNALQAIGNQIIPVISGVVELLLRYLSISLLLAPFGYWAIRLAEPLAWSGAGLLTIYFYFRWEKQLKKKISL